MTDLTRILATASLMAIFASCAGTGQKITVTNDSTLARENETVELCFKTLQDADKALTAENVVVTDEAGTQIPSQVYQEEDGTAVLLFQATVGAGKKAVYSVRAGEREAYPVQAYSRHVPERKDDYAYENNIIAGRIYGPALESPRTFGSDIWVKCTDRLIIDVWFAKRDYHHNYGEGMDCYKVGATLGGGALVPYSSCNEKFVIGDNWASFRHICDGPVRTKALFTYDAFDVDGVKYSASRVLELDANSHFVKSVTAFHPVGHDTDSLNVVLGAIQHDVLAREDGENWIAFTEKASDSKQPDVDGNISIALVYDAAELADNPIKGVGTVAGEASGHAAIITKEASGKPITVWTGSGWSQGGIESPEAWIRLVKDFAYSKSNPLKVEAGK
ncbi:MAG: DUF4861 family protein [Bacteroidales bacterium]|nr:DUF4861 family protein [Bacteroidales bacterium]